MSNGSWEQRKRSGRRSGQNVKLVYKFTFSCRYLGFSEYEQSLDSILSKLIIKPKNPKIQSVVVEPPNSAPLSVRQ